MLIVSFLVFSCIAFSSGDSSSYILSEDATESEVEAYQEMAGLNEPFFTRYVSFLFSFITGDWGRSAGGNEIRELIAARLPVTLSVSFLALLVSLLIAVPLSYLTLEEKTAGSVISTSYAVIISSSPVFLTAIFLVLVFASVLGIFPVAGYIPASEGFFLHLGSVFLPSLSLALLHSALLLLMFRKALRENMKKSFSRTYASLGFSNREIAFKCATKPSLPILIILTGQSAAAFLGGSAAVESIFALPGLGALLVNAALSRDTVLAGILMMLVASMVSLSSLSAEIVSALLDPRNRRKE